VIAARIDTLGKDAPSAAQLEQKQKEAEVHSKFSRIGGKKLGPVLGTAALVLWKAKFIVVLLLTKMKLLLFGFTKIGTLLSMLATMGAVLGALGMAIRRRLRALDLRARDGTRVGAATLRHSRQRADVHPLRRRVRASA
jgi:hypothetical protein